MDMQAKKTTPLDRINIFLNENRIVTVLVFVLAAGLVGINFTRCFDNAFWSDEAFAINLTRTGLFEMIRLVAYYVQSPFYYVVLKAFCTLFSESGFVCHMSAFAAYILLVLTIIFPVRKKYGNITAVPVLIFMSVTESAIGYIVEIRMYEWGCLLLFLSYLLAVEITKTNVKRDWILFSAFSMMAAYTQTYCLIAVAFLYVGIIVVAIFRKSYWKKYGNDITVAEGKKFRIRTVIICAVAVVLYLPWLFVLFYQVGHAAEGWWQQEIPTVMSLFECHFQHTWMMTVYLIVLAIFVANQIKGREGFTEELRVVAFGMALTLGTACVGLGMCYFIRPMFLDKYFYPTAAVSIFVFSYMLSKTKISGVVAVVLSVVVLLLGAFTFKKIYSNDKYIAAGNRMFLSQINFDENTVVYSNLSNYTEAILPCYYPKAEYRDAETSELDFAGTEGKKVYLVWTRPFDNNDPATELIYTGNVGDHIPVWVYKVSNVNN